MDIDSFKNDKFNAIDWINNCFDESATSEENKEAFVSSMVSKLQLYVQQVNSSLEDTSQQLIASMPKILKDVQHLGTDAQTLQTKMSEVQNEISQVQRETGSCMSNLERLDTLKTKLQAAKHGLQESDGWGRLTGELEDLFDQNDIPNACEKIFVLQKSLAAQAGLPGQNEREVQVEEAKNKLEALSSPNVVKAFSSGDLEQSKIFVEMFQKIGRLSQLKQYYRTVQKTNLARQWAEIVDRSNSNRFLREFYEILLENWQKQMRWCCQVFGDQKQFPEPSQILIELLGSLEPSRETTINNALKRNSDKVDVLKECSAANLFFGEMLQKHLDNAEVESPKEHLVALSRAVFDYFNPFIAQFAAVEQNWLANQLVQLSLNQTNPAESIRILGNSNTKVVQFVQDALKRCETITRNCAICPLISVINAFFREYLDKYKKAQKQLEVTRATEESWNLIQTCTTLLQHIGDLMMGLEELQTVLITTLNETYANVCRQELTAFQYKVLKKQDVNELKKMVNSLKEYQAEDEFPLFRALIKDIVNPICAAIHDTTLISIFQPIEMHLKNIQPQDSEIHGAGEDLPDYSFAPQEYITQVGQYLMTLPQHLEPLLLTPSKTLRLALEHSDEKYAKDIPCGDVFLSMIADESCALFVDNVVQFQQLSNYSSKQLATDIEYLGSVLEELDLKLSKTLQQMSILLRASENNYLNVSAGCDPKLVMTIRQKRNLKLTSCD